MTSSKFLQGLSPAGLEGFARVMTSYADDLGAMLHDIAGETGYNQNLGQPDTSFLPADVRLDINIAAVNAFGHDFDNHYGEIYDDLFQDLGLPEITVEDFDDPLDLPGFEGPLDQLSPRSDTMEMFKSARAEIDANGFRGEFSGGMMHPGIELGNHLANARRKYGDIFHMKKVNENGLPRLMIMGHGRHGKDTVCQILEEHYGLRWVSSSWKCAEMVVCRILEDRAYAKEFLDTLEEGMRARLNHQIIKYYGEWKEHAQQNLAVNFTDWAFSVRGDYRELWYQAIRWYNWGDATKLCREIMEVADAYCGIRDARELTAIWNSDLLDDVIWVDASKRVPLESPESISVTPEMATLYIDNNHDLERLRIAVMQLMWGQYGLLPKT